ncbi:hypothetical protein [Leptolyngbya sp. BC1307]|uniref:hypothetical protein n=1 Tax=Leptolyngbya sp. BC1307 TaxID=2029589 RepID=UPI000EFA55B4|nr:hypothetical protein [Leptolyngbya sp. BC1307]
MVDKQANKSVTVKTSKVNKEPLSGADLDQQVQQQMALKQKLFDFVLEAEDEVAIALEAFSAQQLSRWAKPSLSGISRTDLAVDMFLTEGQVADQSVIDLFIQSDRELSAASQNWLKQWKKGFSGLFAVCSAKPERYVLMNWLTEKLYSVTPNQFQAPTVLSRLSPGEIVIARLLPVTDRAWTFSGPLTLLGKLGEPKLAVAIGNFKQWFPQYLYGDAPELKEAAWDSVKQQHEDFVAFFGAEKLTMPGRELNQKLKVYQEQATESQFAQAGLDSSKSLQTLAEDSGLSAEEIEEAMTALGEESKVAKRLLESGRSLKMVMPKVDLPDELRHAESVTVFAHPRWGQTFLTDYSRLKELLARSGAAGEQAEAEETAKLDRLVIKHLENEQAIAPVWYHLAKEHGKPLEASLRRILGNPDFDIEQDLDGAIARYGKLLTPQIPESASVPLHLHNLFQSALQTVSKSTAKKKAKKKSGFGA